MNSGKTISVRFNENQVRFMTDVKKKSGMDNSDFIRFAVNKLILELETGMFPINGENNQPVGQNTIK